MSDRRTTLPRKTYLNMNDEASFLRAIRERSDDDGLRLEYADWLDGQGDVRSEFLRIQMKMRRLLESDPARQAIKSHVAEIRRSLDPAWLVWVDEDLAMPPELSPVGRRAAEVILEFLAREGRCDTGGCKAFYSPVEWQERDEEYGLEAPLIVVHDGGDLASYFSFDACDYALYERQVSYLRQHGFFAEQCTSWYSAVCEASRSDTV